ncbi:MAG: hypothetical protein KAI70_03915 [Candidatus Omnitrophica bacterium]|nr:hypothetical protein [Candidatus Omnitrophota bacterium]
MGWQGALRSLEAASRRAERECQCEQKALAKRQQLENAAFEVEEFEEKINSLISMQDVCLAKFNWEKVKGEVSPSKPENLRENEIKATAKLNNFKPNVLHKLFKTTEVKLEKLRKNVQEAKKKDEKQHKKNTELYEQNYSLWENDQKISQGVLNGNLDSYIEAFKTISPLDEMEDYIINSVFFPLNSLLAEITVTSKGEQIIPKEIKTLLKSGKLSAKKMPIGQFYETYQDHICSSALRIASEIFALLPIITVVVNILDNSLNTQTGHLEKQPILSVAVPKETLSRLNLSQLDPSDAMKNFICNMNFTKTKGFGAVKKINLEEIDNKE